MGRFTVNSKVKVAVDLYSENAKVLAHNVTSINSDLRQRIFLTLTILLVYRFWNLCANSWY